MDCPSGYWCGRRTQEEKEMSRTRRHYDSGIIKRRKRCHWNNGKEDKFDLNSKAYKARRWRKAADSWIDFPERRMFFARQPRNKGKRR